MNGNKPYQNRQWPQTHWRGRCAALACLQPELQQERKPRPSPEQALNCPRCNSTNTKFCYYNNYSFSQPRYFCKGCRRYWTKGGTLRNVPVGGGCRKNKRSSSSKKPQDHNNATSDFGALLPALPPQPPLVFDSRGLTIPFPPMHRAPGLVDDPVDLALGSTGDGHPPPQAPGFFDVLCTGFLDGGTDALDDLYYGFSGNHGKGENAEGAAAVTPSPLDGLYGETLLAKQEASCKSAGDNKLFLQWQVGGDGGMVVDTAGRNYWNENAGSAWHSLINSSLI